MRCPRCLDDFEPHVSVCPTCRVVLGDLEVAAPAVVADTRLGVFHPLVAEELAALIERRGIAVDRRTEDDEVVLLVARDHRDDLRAELTVTWPDLLRRLPEEAAALVLDEGGTSPGWYDPPRGGHVDRQGRLVVDTEEDAAAEDAARVLGPGLLTVGAILVIVGLFVLDSAAITVLGVGMAVVGLFLPR